ncbi:MAG: HD domain-containing protein [Chloroflexota bacterium]
MDSNSLERLRRIKEFVQARRARTESQGRGQYSAFDYDYRWKHTLRVVQYGKRIAEAEHADVEIVMAACLLHDVSKFDSEEYGVEHGRVSARIARPFLETLGYTPEQVNHICFAVAVHVDDKADFEHPVTLETKIVNDADNVDRFGAYRLLMHYRDQVEEYEQLIARAEKRLLVLRRYLAEELGTPTGERLFRRQLELQITFLERLVEDSTLTIEP